MTIEFDDYLRAVHPVKLEYSMRETEGQYKAFLGLFSEVQPFLVRGGITFTETSEGKASGLVFVTPLGVITTEKQLVCAGKHVEPVAVFRGQPEDPGKPGHVLAVVKLFSLEGPWLLPLDHPFPKAGGFGDEYSFDGALKSLVHAMASLLKIQTETYVA
jgi:hypothetical protein